MNSVCRYLTILFLPFICSCGGGGGDSGSTGSGSDTAATTVNVAGAWQHVLTASQTWTTTGKAPDGSAFSLAFQVASGGSKTFSLTATPGSTSLETLTLSAQGKSPAASTRTIYFVSSGVIGIDNGDGTCSLAAPPAGALSGASPVGSVGQLFVTSDYNDCTNPPGISSGATTSTWSIETDAAVTLFCVNSRSADAVGQFRSKQSICLEAGADGSLLSKARITFFLSDTDSIVTKNY